MEIKLNAANSPYITTKIPVSDAPAMTALIIPSVVSVPRASQRAVYPAAKPVNVPINGKRKCVHSQKPNKTPQPAAEPMTAPRIPRPRL